MLNVSRFGEDQSFACHSLPISETPWRERMALHGTGVYCINPLSSNTLAPSKHCPSPILPCSLLPLWLQHHWFTCPTGACRTPASLCWKLAWGDGSQCAHRTHKTQWKFQLCDNDPDFHEFVKRSKKIARRVQDHAHLCRITCHLSREAERSRNKCNSSSGAQAMSFSLENSELWMHKQLYPKKMATFFFFFLKWYQEKTRLTVTHKSLRSSNQAVLLFSKYPYKVRKKERIVQV